MSLKAYALRHKVTGEFYSNSKGRRVFDTDKGVELSFNNERLHREHMHRVYSAHRKTYHKELLDREDYEIATLSLDT